MPSFRDIRIKEVPPVQIKRTYRPRSPLNFKKLGFFALVVLLIALGINFAVSTARANREISVTLESGLDRMGVADRIGSAMGWNNHEKNVFAGTYAQIQMMAYNSEVLGIFLDRFRWGDVERESFLTLSIKYIEPEFDFLSGTYTPGTYTFKGDASMANISEALVERTKEEEDGRIGEFIKGNLREDAVLKVGELVRKDVELLPDIVPLPAKDVRIDLRGSDVLLSFSTIYFNQGKGPLELIADPATRGIRNDIERDVLQRIYLPGGGYRDRIVGRFLWHQEHLHYHFADFVIYDLEVVDVKNPPDLSGFRVKSTFCIRDVSLVDKDYQIENRAENAKYLICGKEIQGISVGWGDTYFYSYVDQNLNITDLPSGIYRLTFIANPTEKFEESRTDNNTASVLLDIDMNKKTVRVLEEVPAGLPSVEHIYEEQVL